MEMILEVVVELLLEGGTAACANKKISKWIRYPILAILILLFAAVVGLFLFAGVMMTAENPVTGISLMIVGLAMLIGVIVKVRRYRKSGE